jgi:hypothetical protein
MPRPFALFVAASAAFMTVVLLADRDGWPAQLVLGTATAIFLVFFARRSATPALQIVCAVVIATTGEVVLSLGWRLYAYSHAVIPLYVPPGHGLFYLLAAETARQPIIRRYAAGITRGVLVSGSLIAVVSLALYADAWGFAWWLGALALLHFSRNKLLLSACFGYTILLEWLGTALGNWRWASVVPFVGLQSANPPAGVGILYILLDLFVVAASSAIGRALVPLASVVSRHPATRSPIPFKTSAGDTPSASQRRKIAFSVDCSRHDLTR